MGGSGGQPCGNRPGGAGGGALVLRVGGNLNVSGTLTAKGDDGPTCAATAGTQTFGGGGGGGGFIVAAVQSFVQVTGMIDVSGGSGDDGSDGVSGGHREAGENG